MTTTEWIRRCTGTGWLELDGMVSEEKRVGSPLHPRRAGDAQYCRRRRGPRTSTRGTNIWGNRLDQDQKLRSEVIFVNILADSMPETAKKECGTNFWDWAQKCDRWLMCECDSAAMMSQSYPSQSHPLFIPSTWAKTQKCINLRCNRHHRM